MTDIGASGSWHRRPRRSSRPVPAHRPRPPSRPTDVNHTIDAISDLRRDQTTTGLRYYATLLAFVWIRPWKHRLLPVSLLLGALALVAKVAIELSA